ncbi:MAG: hypothetical protein EXS02_13535 [Planctomycetes bacterium]|nr:hypothetical protein [Planctomycetota bacterium]
MMAPLWFSVGMLASGGEPPLAGPSAGACYHAVVDVTDPLSHGILGDGLLSLNEAIRLHNGTLLWSQLSLAEQAEVQLIPGTGSSLAIAWIDIDGSSTPVITIERDLEPILDTTFGLLIRGTNDAPVLDFSGPGITHGLRAPANAIALQDLILSGGPYGIDVTQTDVAGQLGATFLRVRVENTAQFGVRVTASTAAGIGRVILEDCAFTNCPVALTCSESGAARTTIFEARNVRVAGGATGFQFVSGPGGTARYTLDRLTIDASGHGLRVQRPVGANRTTLIESTFVQIRAQTCAAIECAPTGVTWATLRMWDLRAPLGGTALSLGLLGDSLYGDLDELNLDGATSVRAGVGPQPITLHNLRCRNGAVAVATSTSQTLSILASRFDNCQLQSQGSGPIPLQGCCGVATSVTGTATAPFVANDCHLPGAGAFVQQTGSLVLPQLGSMSIAPETVQVGSTVTFQANLPSGLFGLFVLGYTDPVPVLLPRPLHVYSQPALTFTVPGIYRLQQSYAWTLPAIPWLAGLDFVAQIAVVPDAGMVAPWLQLPPGRRFVLQ